MEGDASPVFVHDTRRRSRRFGNNENKQNIRVNKTSNVSLICSPRNYDSILHPRLVTTQTSRRLCTLVLPFQHTDNNSGVVTDSAGTDPTEHSSNNEGGIVEGIHMDTNASIVSDATNVTKNTGSTMRTDPRHNNTQKAVGGGKQAKPYRQQQHAPNQGPQNRQLPLVRRGMAPGCDPILACGGEYVLAATLDGCVCVYPIYDFCNPDGDEDVELSGEQTGQRPGIDWWDARFQMQQRMKVREEERDAVEAIQTVGPFFVGPFGHDSQEEDDNHGENPTTAAIVAMCAGPRAVSLIKHLCRYRKIRHLVPMKPTLSKTSNDDRNRRRRRHQNGEEKKVSYDEICNDPSSYFLGHVAVLTLEGDVHLLDFRLVDASKRFGRDEHSSSGSHDSVDEISSDRVCPSYSLASTELQPRITIITSFHTGHFGATCICFRRMPNLMIPSEENEINQSPAFRICVGHEAGIIVEFEMTSTVECSLPEDQEKGSATHTFQAMESADATVAETRGENDLKNAESESLELAEINNERSTICQDTTRKDVICFGSDANVNCVKSSTEALDNADATTAGTSRTYFQPLSQMKWRGKFDCAVRSLSSLGGMIDAKNDGLEHKKQTSGLANLRRMHLAVGLAERENPVTDPVGVIPATAGTAASCIEVIDTDLVEKAWISLDAQDRYSNRESCTRTMAGNVPTRTIQLEDHCTWPGIGMEMKESWTWSDGDYLTDVGNNGRGKGARRSVAHVANKMCSSVGDHLPAFATAVSDGTVAIHESTLEDTCTEQTFSWGLSNTNNQVVLANPCIGLSLFDDTEIAEHGSHFLKHCHSVACCLRGGTVFVVPIVSQQTNTTDAITSVPGQEVTMYQFPNDPNGDDDGFCRYVQGFVAGYGRVRRWRANELDVVNKSFFSVTPQPLLLYAWAGGLIDVFSCNLSALDVAHTGRTSGKETSGLLDMLVENGTVAEFVNFLLALDEDDDLCREEIWRKAREECKSADNVHESIIESVRDKESKRFPFIEAALLSLAKSS